MICILRRTEGGFGKLKVFLSLFALNPTKAQGPDGIPGWALKENADILAGPVSDVVNSSFCKCQLPSSRKEANIVPYRPLSKIAIYSLFALQNFA